MADTPVNDPRALALRFAREMRARGYALDFTVDSLRTEIDRLLRSAHFQNHSDSAQWEQEVLLQAYVGETLRSAFRGEWAGFFHTTNPGVNFYSSEVVFGQYAFRPSHYLSYRISNGEASTGTFADYLERVLPQIKRRQPNETYSEPSFAHRLTHFVLQRMASISPKLGIALVMCLVGALASAAGYGWAKSQYIDAEAVRVVRQFVAHQQSRQQQLAASLLHASTWQDEETVRRLHHPCELSQFLGIYPFQTNGNRLRRRLLGVPLDPELLKVEMGGACLVRFTLVRDEHNQWRIRRLYGHAG